MNVEICTGSCLKVKTYNRDCWADVWAKYEEAIAVTYHQVGDEFDLSKGVSSFKPK